MFDIIELQFLRRKIKHMITGELRNKVDKLWEVFWTGGITNPLSVIEQFTYLLFIKGLDDIETTKEKVNFLGIEYEGCFQRINNIYAGANLKFRSAANV